MVLLYFGIEYDQIQSYKYKNVTYSYSIDFLHFKIMYIFEFFSDSTFVFPQSFFAVFNKSPTLVNNISKDEIGECKGKEIIQNQKWANIRGTPCKLTKIGVLQRFLQKKEGEE